MKVYLSGSIGAQGGLRAIAAGLRLAGHEVVSSWLEADITAADFDTPSWFNRWTKVDIEDVERCDVLICFNEPGTPGHRGRGGKHTELGAALALKKRVALVGEASQPFHYHPGVEFFQNWPEAELALGLEI